MSCNFFAPNGKQSALAQYLEQQYGEKETIRLWNELNSESFLSTILDWKTDTTFNTEDGELQPEKAIELLQKFGVLGKAPLASEAQPVAVQTTEVPTNPTAAILAEYTFPNQDERVPKTVDEATMLKSLGRMFAEKRNAAGELTGHFEDWEQVAAVDSILTDMHAGLRNTLANGDTLTAGALVDALKNSRVRFSTFAKTLQEGERKAAITDVVNSFDQLAAFAMERLRAYGFNINDRVIDKIGDYLKSTAPKGDLNDITDNPDQAIPFEDVESGTDIGGAEQRGLRDWSDVTFELNPQDTASKRLKFFMSTIKESELGLEDAPKALNMVFGNEQIKEKILSGEKRFTVRTPTQADRIKFGPDGRGSVTVENKVFEVQEVKRLNTAEELNQYKSIFNEEQVDLIPGTVLYSVDEFKPRGNFPKSKLSYLGFPVLANFEGLFTDVMGLLSNTEPGWKNYRNLLWNSGKANFMRLVQELDNSDQQLRNEFVKVMTKQYQPFTIVLFNRKTRPDGTKIMEARPINANRASATQVIMDAWKENQKESAIITTSDSGRLAINEELASSFQKTLDNLNNIGIDNLNESNKAGLQAFGKRILEANGIVLSDEAFNDLFINTSRYTKKSSFAGDWASQFAVTKDGKPSGIFSAIIMKLSGKGGDEDKTDIEIDEDSFLKNNNPMYTEKSAMSILANIAAKWSPKLYSATHRSSEGKTIYDYGLNTYESHEIRKLKDDPEYLAQLATVTFAKRSWLLRNLQNSSEQRTRLQLAYLDGLKSRYSRNSDGVTRSEMSNREQNLTVLSMFQNTGYKYGHFVDMTKSDKSTTPVLMNIQKLNLTSSMSNQKVVQDELNEVFLSEFERIKEAANPDYLAKFNNAQYVKGAGLFYLLPHFNYSEMQKAAAAGTISDTELASIWNSDGSVSTAENVVDRSNAVRKINIRFTKQMAEDTMSEWKRDGILTDDNHMFDASWTKKAEKLLNIKSTKDNNQQWIFVVIEKNPTGGTRPRILTKAEYNEMLGRYAALEYSVSYFLFNTSMAQLISGDPALVYKPAKNGSAIDNVVSTLKEYQKRLAKDIGPGSDPAWNRNEVYKTITLADFDYESYLAKFGLDAYKSFDTSTDAQELTTVKEHLYVMYSEGKVPVKTYHEMLEIIDAGLKTKDKYYEFTDPSHLSIVLQPHKPVYVGSQIHDGVKEIHYVKSSSYPLLPQLTKGLQIDELRTAMEDTIERANFKSAKKIGSPKVPLNIFDSKGSILSETLDTNSPTFTGATQVLTREGFRIQQEVPYDEEKEAIRTVSQMNKLISEGTANINGFQYHDASMSGKELRAEKERIRSQMIEMGTTSFLKKVGAVQDELGNYSFASPGKLFKALEEEAISRKYPTNDIEALRLRYRNEGKTELVLPLWFNGSADRFESLMMSLVKKIVEVKMPGKSFVQASSAGYKSSKTLDQLSVANQSGITWLPDYDPSRGLRSLDKTADGSTIPAQVLVPFNFFGSDGKLLNISDFTKTDEAGRTVIDTEKLPVELLQFIGARIPNQGHNSMLPIQIAGFLPKTLGDLMIVPPEITQQMGSDFDVDKLYVYKRKYKVVDGKLKVYEESEEAGTTLEGLKNNYFDIHWSVLIHPDMFEKILKPLDKPDLKNEKTLAEARVNKQGFHNYFHVQSQLADFQSQKDAKRLVGSSSLSTTFNALIQDKDLRLGRWDYENNKEIPKYIIFKDEVTGEDIKLHRLSGEGIAKYYEKENPTSSDIPLERTKHDNITSQQSEFLDHAKNRTIDFLNINNFTYPASAAMSMLETDDGQALNLKYNSRLLQQEAILEYSREMAQSGDSLSDEFTPDLKAATFERLKQKYAVLAGVQTGSFERLSMSPQEMEALLNTKNKDKAYYAAQLSLLDQFEELDSVGTRLVEIQASLNQDTNAAGPSLLYSLNQKQRLQGLLANDLIQGVEDIAGTFNADGTFNATSEIGTTYKNTTELANELYTQILPYDRMQGLFKEIAAFSGVKQLSVDRQRESFRELKSFMFSANALELAEDVSTERARLLYDTDAGISLAKRVQEAKRTWGKGNYLLARLQTNIAEEPGLASTVQYNASKASTLDDYENIKAWIALLRGTDDAKKLGEDLITYVYSTGGIQNAISFVKFVPISYLASIPFASKLRSLNEVINLENPTRRSAYLTQFYQHNPNRAIQLSSDLKELGEDIAKQVAESSVPVEQFSLPIIGTEHNAAQKLIIANPDRSEGAAGQIYPPYLSVRGPKNTYILYRRNDEIASDQSTGYTRIDTLGQKQISEYGYDKGVQRSIFPENRALISPPRALDPIDVLTQFQQIKNKVDQPIPEAFNKLGFKDGAEFSTVADNLIASEEVNAVHKAVLNILKPIINHEVELFKDIQPLTLGFLDSTNRTLSAEGRSYTIMGGYKHSGGEGKRSLVLNPDALSNITDIAEIFSHESLHAVTALTVARLEKSPESEHTSLVGTKTAAAYQNLKALWQFSKDALPVNASPALVYSHSNMKEFIAALFEGEKDTLAHTNNLIDPGNPAKTVFEKIADLVRDLIEALSEYIGYPVKEGSVLASSIRESLHLMGYESAAEAGPVMDISSETAQNDEIIPTKYQLFPGVLANNEQREAIDRIISFVGEKADRIKKEDNYFVLSGAGGTGKTTIIKKIVQELIDKNVVSKDQVVYSGLTHTAVQQLRRSVNDRSYAYGTIQSLLGIRKDERASIEQGKEIFAKDFGVIAKIEDYSVIVIDESSMLSDEQMSFLRDSIFPNQKIIFMGDYAQLEPVGQSTDAYPFRDLLTNQDRSAVLLKNERTSHADIVDLLSNYRKAVDEIREGKSKSVLNVLPFAPRQDSSNVSFDNDGKKFFEDYLTKVTEAIKNADPYDTILIAYRNETRKEINQLSRKRIFGDDVARFVPGDLLINNATYKLSSETARRIGQEALYNMQRAIVKTASPVDIERQIVFSTGKNQVSSRLVKAKGWQLSIDLGPEYKNAEIQAEYLEPEELEKLIGMAYDAGSKSAIMKSDGKKLPYGQYAAFKRALADAFLNVEYAYAVTSHKSQGMTYPNVFVHEADIMSVGPASDTNKIKSLYTAYSRTKEHLSIYNPQNPTQTDLTALTSTEGSLIERAQAAFFPGKTGPYQVSNAAEFDMMKQRIEQAFPGIQVDMIPGTGQNAGRLSYDFSQVEPKLREQSASTVVRTEMDKAISNLMSLKDALYKKLVKPTGRDITWEELGQYEVLKQEIQVLENDITQLKASRDLTFTEEIAQRQLNWVSETLKKPGIVDNINDIHTAMNVANTWNSVFDELYGVHFQGELPENVVRLKGDAALKLKKVFGLAQQYYLKNGKVIDNSKDFDAENMGTNILTAYNRDISRVGSRVGQEVASLLQNSARNRDAELNRMSKKFQKYNDKIHTIAKKTNKKVADVYSIFFQDNEAKNAWGLIQQHSQDYFDFRKTTRETLNSSLAVAEKADVTDIVRKKMVAAAWSKYNKEVRHNLVFIDTMIFFDRVTGDLKDDEATKQEKTRLLEHVDQSDIDRMITKAQEKYIQHLHNKDAYQAALVQKNIKEIDDLRTQLATSELSQEERDQILISTKERISQEFNRDLNVYDTQYSPNSFFEKLAGKAGINQKFRNYQGIVDAPRRSVRNGAFYDADYQRVQGDADLKEIYDFIKDSLQTFMFNLPEHITSELGANFLPIVAAKNVLDMSSLKGVGNYLEEGIKDTLTTSPQYADYANSESRAIPIRYTKPGSVVLEERERNIMVLLEKFGTMSYHYKHFSTVEASVEVLQELINASVNVTEKGLFGKLNDRVKNLSDMTKTAKDVLMYQRPKKAEYEVGPLYSLSPLEQIRKTNEVKQLNKEKSALDDKYANGDLTTDEYNEQRNDLDLKLVAYENTVVYGSKIGDAAIKMTELKALSYNPFSAVANLSFGLVSVLIHGNGRRDFNQAQVMQSFSMMLNATKRAISFGTAESQTAEKILNIMDRMNIMGDLLDSDYGEHTRVKASKDRWKRFVSPYQMLRQSDYFVKGLTVVAMTLNKKVTDSGTGKEISLWEALDDQGNWRLGENKAWTSDDVTEQIEWRKFQDQAIVVTKNIMGNQDSASPLMIKRSVLGRLVSQFRVSWMAEGFAAKFENEKYDDQLGRNVKGRYRTYGDLGIFGSLLTLGRQALSTLVSIDPFTRKRRDGTELSDVDVENMRKNLTEVAFFMGVAAAILMLRYASGDEDDPKKKAGMKLLLNTLIRNRQDISFFASPSLFDTVTKNTIPAWKVWVDFERAMAGTGRIIGNHGFGMDPNDKFGLEQWALRMTKAGIPHPYLGLINKVKVMAEKDLDTFTQ